MHIYWDDPDNDPKTLDEMLSENERVFHEADVVDSLRFLLDEENVAPRCRARLCRTKGRCHAICNADGKLICHAGNPGEAMLKRVERLTNLIRHCRHG